MKSIDQTDPAFTYEQYKALLELMYPDRSEMHIRKRLSEHLESLKKLYT